MFRNAQFRVSPRHGERGSRYVLDTASDPLPQFVPVVVTGANDGLGRAVVELATDSGGNLDKPLPGQGGILIYEPVSYTHLKGLTILDPCKVIPVGNFMFGQERLIYIADPFESKELQTTLAGPNSSDLVVSQLIEDQYIPDIQEEMELGRITGQYGLRDRLFLLKEDNVWRITSTRPDYQRFADVRAMSVFPWLDMKHNLQEMDRTDILGNLNAIILVKKGTDDKPAKPGEIAQAGAQVQQSSRIPIIVSDHRLEIEIITRKTDKTLAAERYNAIDSRVTARLFQILQTGNYAAGTATDTSGGLFKIIASTMEARRDNIADSIMAHVTVSYTHLKC